MGKIIIYAMAKDEDAILVQWVHYQLLIGADIVHIIDDQSVIPITTTLRATIE